MTTAAAERRALCETLDRVGGDAPTLSGDWDAAHLAAHLVVRESRPLDMLGIVVPALAGRTERATRRLATTTPFPALVERVRTGPPTWHPARLRVVDDAMNLVEIWVHHEDVLRAGTGATRRTVDEQSQKQLWAALRRMGRLLGRSAPVGMILDSGHGRITAKDGKGGRSVTVHGTPGELLLFAFGRQSVADVELDGSPADIAALRTADLGI